MSREEFSRKVKEQALARAAGKCERKSCGATLTIGKIRFDHILPCALGGKPVLANCMVLCDPCHKLKTAREDVPRIRKADRQRARHLGTTLPAKSKIASRPKETKPPSDKLPLPPRRSLYERE